MAIINKIREKSGLAVGVVAVGLILFIVGGDLLGPNSVLLGNRTQDVGEIAGETVSLEEYQQEIEQLKMDFAMNTGRTPSEAEMPPIREQAWNQLIFKKAYQKQFEKLGLTVTEEEQYDMVQGNNIHPAVRNSFANPETQEFDVEQVRNFLRNIDRMDPQQQAMWYNFEAKLNPDRLRSKYENMLSKTHYITKAEAEREYLAQNTKANFNYLYVPYSAIADSAVTVTDAMLEEELEQNKEKYKVEETRTFDYVVFSVTASKEDSAYINQEMNALKEQFKATENDSAFARSNSDNYVAPYVANPGELPAELTANLSSIKENEVYGPYAQGQNMVLYKVIDVNTNGASSARASHILIRPKSESAEDKAAAFAEARKVLNEIKAGASFEEMAKQHGTDGTATRGGDLGWFSEGKMVKPFEDAIFKSNRTGLLPEPVETDFGYHIIKITAPKTNVNYQIATVQRAIDAGDASRDEIFRAADQFAGTASNLAEFEENVKNNPALTKATAEKVSKNAYYVNNLPEARELVKWAFNDASVGDVSPVFEVGDQYVVAVLTGSTDKGYASVDDVRQALTFQARNKAKADLILNKLKPASGSLEQVASAYGAQATVNNATDVTLATNSVTGIGFDPLTVGKAFGLKEGEKSAPFASENGVVIVETTKITAAPEIADYNSYKSQIAQKIQGRSAYFISEAIKEKADIKDQRVRFF
jgi:peptidyl-prolyl cis-trans isomerase D